MKRILIFMLCLLLVGCAQAPQEPVSSAAPPAETTAPTEPTATEPALPELCYDIYLPNENADGFKVETVDCHQITADAVLAELQNRGALPDDVAILAFGSEGSRLTVDFNQAFGDLVCSTGTSGEMMIVGSVVNTFLSAFQADSLFFTVEGEILESGHVIYDEPFFTQSIMPIS